MQQKRAGGPSLDALIGKRFLESPAEYEGVVRSRGAQFGFIECEVTFAMHNKDVYFNPKTVGPAFSQMKTGAWVRFAVIVENDGQPRACNVTVLAGGDVLAAQQDGGRSFVGMIKSKTPKYGFIECADTFGIYGKDIFVLPSQIGDDIYNAIQVNSEISFEVSEEAEGPRARSVRLLSGPGAAQQQSGFPGAAPLRSAAYAPQPPAYSPAVLAGPGGPPGRLYDGIVKKHGAKYGFIDSAELNTAYGSDVMFFPTIVGGDHVYAEMVPGTAVRFAVSFEGGKPRACAPVTFPGRAEPRGRPGQGKGPPAMQVPMQARDYQGVIKTKGDKYAFVECLELQPIFPGKDIFVNPKYVGDDVFNLLEAGTAVRFQYTMDAGKPRATSCSIAGGPTLGGVPRKRAAPVAAAATPPGEPLTFTGKIMSKSDKFGFIESAECRAQFGKDIFFIPKNIGDQVYEQMEIGKHVVVSVEIQDGRPRAVALLNME